MEIEASEAIKTHRDLYDDAEQGHAQDSEIVNSLRPTIFNHLLLSKLPAQEKTKKRLGEEAFSIIAAGGETVARTLTIATYHLLANPAALERLRTEIRDSLPELSATLGFESADKLPWLVGTIMNRQI